MEPLEPYCDAAPMRIPALMVLAFVKKKFSNKLFQVIEYALKIFLFLFPNKTIYFLYLKKQWIKKNAEQNSTFSTLQLDYCTFKILIN
jgi:hypothetical protein